MKCPKCKTENPEGLKFCGKCGANGWVTKAYKKLAALLK
jgi:hypothetical protein